MKVMLDKRKNTFIGYCIVIMCLVSPVKGQSVDPLLFPKDKFTIEKVTVKTSHGEKQVTYHFYKHIPYVSKPVDDDYQSLNVKVPVEVDGQAVDAANAPVFFEILVGGYMSVRNAFKGKDAPASGMGGPPGAGNVSGRSDLALAAGYVVVTPGCRGRDNKAADGTYYGKAPAVIVDLKAAVRYIRYNKGVLPGNPELIVSVGCSAGGAISALLGTSGNSPLFESYLKEIGAADEKDNIFGSACYSPIADLEHADGAYEWNYGTISGKSGLVDQELSAKLKALNAEYQKSLALKGKSNFGVITAENYDKYLLQYYLVPSANEYLKHLPEIGRKQYLGQNPWITWNGTSSAFSFADYATHAGRMKSLPAFDDFNATAPEPVLFGNKTTNARHFTDFSLQQSSKDPGAKLDNEMRALVNLMNPMFFTGQKNNGCAVKWWLRNGTSDAHTSQTVMVNLAVSLENMDRDVNALVFWDGGHCADDDPEGMVAWMGTVTGYSRK